MPTWDERHRSAPLDLTPEPLLVRVAEKMKSGRALDLACGTGRNAVWLAGCGWSVTAIDSSPAAIEILRSRDPGIQTKVADLESYSVQPESWDLIVICRYLQRDLFEPAKRGVVPGGAIVAVALLDHPRFGVAPGELKSYFSDWEIIEYSETSTAEVASRKPCR